MTINEYQEEAMKLELGMERSMTETRTRMEKSMNELYPRLFNGLIGLNGEAGEAIDLLKKHIFQGHDLDKEHMAKELGDVAWYLAVSANAIGYDLETIFQMSVDKIKKTLSERI